MKSQRADSRLRLTIKSVLLGWLLTSAWMMGLAVLKEYDLSTAALPVAVTALLFTAICVLFALPKLASLQGDARTRPSADLTLPLPSADAFARCVDAMRALPEVRLRRADEASGTITAITRGSFWEASQGDRLRLRLRSMGATTEVRISSRPRQPLLLLDYGRNEELLARAVERIYATVGELEQREPVTGLARRGTSQPLESARNLLRDAFRRRPFLNHVLIPLALLVTIVTSGLRLASVDSLGGGLAAFLVLAVVTFAAWRWFAMIRASTDETRPPWWPSSRSEPQ